MLKFRQYWKRILLAILLMIVIALAVFVVWASTPAGDLMPPAIEAMQSTESVTVSTENWLVFTPEQPADTGFIFYPGGRVQGEAYSPMAHALADAGYLAVIVPMPLNLAVFNVEGAMGVMDGYPEVENWVISGHSLGGSMAARFAYNHPDEIDGLVIMAAYPEEFADFSQRDIVVATIYGEFDGLATVEQVESSAPLLPDDTEFVMIEGGNHAQFGWYGAQAGDNDATISREAQQAQIIDATLDVLDEVSQ